MSQFSGRSVLVTGGASGLGLATGLAFAARGARTYLADLSDGNTGGAATDTNALIRRLRCDVTSESDAKRAVRTIVANEGRLDVLVNCAGIEDAFVPTVDQSLEHWNRLIAVHLTGAWIMSKAAARPMLEMRSGVILNVSSIGGVLGLPVRTAYSAAKAGISMMTRTLACEWAPRGIRVNAVAPGYIMTPLVERLVADKRLDISSIERRTPMGRLGEPDDIAQAMLFLASEEAKFITGITLPVDGGYMSFGAPSDAHPGSLSE